MTSGLDLEERVRVLEHDLQALQRRLDRIEGLGILSLHLRKTFQAIERSSGLTVRQLSSVLGLSERQVRAHLAELRKLHRGNYGRKRSPNGG
jgi:DNA-binding transcriptional ArsR family regulator